MTKTALLLPVPKNTAKYDNQIKSHFHRNKKIDLLITRMYLIIISVCDSFPHLSYFMAKQMITFIRFKDIYAQIALGWP